MDVARLLSVWAVPVFVAAVLVTALVRRVPVFDEFTVGAGEGLRTCVKILPSLVALMTAVSMLQASGLLEQVTSWIAPAAEKIGPARPGAASGLDASSVR